MWHRCMLLCCFGHSEFVHLVCHGGVGPSLECLYSHVMRVLATAIEKVERVCCLANIDAGFYVRNHGILRKISCSFYFRPLEYSHPLNRSSMTSVTDGRTRNYSLFRHSRISFEMYFSSSNESTLKYVGLVDPFPMIFKGFCHAEFFTPSSRTTSRTRIICFSTSVCFLCNLFMDSHG